MNKQDITNDNNNQGIIRSLLHLKHKSQTLIHKKLSFPLPAADIILLAPIQLHQFHSEYQDILNSIKSLKIENMEFSHELSKFPKIQTERYENSLLKRAILLTIAFLLFFPVGVFIYYLVLSRRGELKLKLAEIINTSHRIIHLIHLKSVK